MKTFDIKNILTPTDFSDTAAMAIEHSAFMARMSRATLHLLHVIKVSEFTYAINNPATLSNNLDDLENFCIDKLQKIASDLNLKHGINIKTTVSRGNPVQEIETAVASNHIDVVVMGTHGLSGFNEYFIGSNAHKTIKRCPCPVITVRADSQKTGFQHIVLPIENSYHSLEKVNRTVDLAKLYAAKIHLLGVRHDHEELALKKFDIMIENVESVIAHAGVAYDKTIIDGDHLGEQTLKFAKKMNADLIVILADKESELNDTPFGALAKQMVNHTKIPVLSIKPKEGKFAPLSAV
ncbi:MAG: universal stress protein [Bacteroidota bacterium]|jgi:nucleotide-binding universal stress UspA family protein